jgi:hypothetical protein
VDYRREYPLAGITRIRRGKISATIIHKDNSRWISIHHGQAVVNAVRFASAFFGKGQFVPGKYEKREDGYYFEQQLQGRYLQPVTESSLLPVRPDTWSALVAKRRMTEICRLVYEGCIRETPEGFDISISAHGTNNVPLAIEISLREGGEISGVSAATHTRDAFLFNDGFAEYRMGADAIRFGPGKGEHSYVQVRGAEGKLPGPSVYLTGYTPFEHTVKFQML